MLYEKGFAYDSSMLSGTGELDLRSKPQWPVTLDTKWRKCYTPKCPGNTYPGLWEFGIQVIYTSIYYYQGNCKYEGHLK